MALNDHLRKITPDKSQILTNTRGLKIGDKFIVNGIGGDFIPGGGSTDVQIGQIVNGQFVPNVYSGTSKTPTAGTAESYSTLYTYNTPNPVPAGGETDFYKCASVDTTANTWTGYKAVLSGGVYTFESTVTSGLTYSTITPVVGTCYNDGALIKAVPFTGIPLDYSYYFTNDISELTAIGTAPAATTYQGIPCIQLTGEGCFAKTGLTMPWSTFTFSAFVNMTSTSNQVITGFGKWQEHCGMEFLYNGTIAKAYQERCSDEISYTCSMYGGWHHLLYTNNSGVATFYLDGVSRASSTSHNLSSMSSYNLYLGGNPNSSGDTSSSRDGYMTGYLSDVGLWDRILTQDEITMIYSYLTGRIQNTSEA